MSTYKIPAPDAPAEEWGLLAVSLPGWRWMLTMSEPSGLISLEWVDDQRKRVRCWDIHGSCIGEYTAYRMIPDPDDPATEGCLFALLGDERDSIMVLPNTKGLVEWHNGADFDVQSLPLGRACIAAAAALGRWPGGEG